MNKLIITIFILTVGMISIVACVSSDENVAPTQIAQTIEAKFAATAAIEQALGVALTGTASVPTVTPTITLTPTPTETITPTPPPMATVIIDNVPVFAGPGFFFGAVTKLNLGEQIVLLGISEDGLWLFIQLSATDQGWIALEHTDPHIKISILPAAEEPPREEFTITIKNSANYPHSILLFNVQDLGLSYTIQAGSSITINVLAGLHHFSFGVIQINCQKSTYITQNVYWEYKYSINQCDLVP